MGEYEHKCVTTDVCMCIAVKLRGLIVRKMLLRQGTDREQ